MYTRNFDTIMAYLMTGVVNPSTPDSPTDAQWLDATNNYSIVKMLVTNLSNKNSPVRMKIAKNTSSSTSTPNGSYPRLAIGYPYTMKIYPLPSGNIGSDASHIGLAFGSGTTTPTYFDYCLESYVPQQNNYSVSNASATPLFDSTGTYIQYQATLTNISQNDIVLGEVGYFVNLGHFGTGSDYPAVALMFRETFTPVTIVPNGTFIFNIKIKIADMFPNKPTT